MSKQKKIRIFASLLLILCISYGRLVETHVLPQQIYQLGSYPPIIAKIKEVESEQLLVVPTVFPTCPKLDFSIPSLIADQLCQKISYESKKILIKHRLLQDSINTFYYRRNYQPAWINHYGKLLPSVEELLKTILEADSDGLRSSDYSYTQLRRLQAIVQQQTVIDVQSLAEFDLLLTRSFLTYASHLLSGRITPQRINPDWVIKPRSRDLAKILQDTLINKSNISESLHALAPKDNGYIQLRKILQKYRQLEQQQGDWPKISYVKPGAYNLQVARLRARLYASGDLPLNHISKKYDKELTEAIRCFQKRHGLTENGYLNNPTLQALNISISQRIRQVELNMERWRWLPDELGVQQYIIVNIPSFKMYVFENNKKVIETKVIVGRRERQTPIVVANMTYLVMSPKWYIPHSIAINDKLPQIKHNPHTLAEQDIRVYNSLGRQINPGQVNWKNISKVNFNYKLQQDAGPHNALGGIKFIFPNPYNIYLHDTPLRSLFSHKQRTFSSGCIRIANPLELAEYLLRDDLHWNKQAIRVASTSGKQKIITLPQPIPVFILYWTAWIDENNFLNFREDIYNLDKNMAQAIDLS